MIVWFVEGEVGGESGIEVEIPAVVGVLIEQDEFALGGGAGDGEGIGVDPPGAGDDDGAESYGTGGGAEKGIGEHPGADRREFETHDGGLPWLDDGAGIEADDFGLNGEGEGVGDVEGGEGSLIAGEEGDVAEGFGAADSLEAEEGEGDAIGESLGDADGFDVPLGVEYFGSNLPSARFERRSIAPATEGGGHAAAYGGGEEGAAGRVSRAWGGGKGILDVFIFHGGHSTLLP